MSVVDTIIENSNNDKPEKGQQEMERWLYKPFNTQTEGMMEWNIPIPFHEPNKLISKK